MPHFDKLETRTPDARQADQLAALLAQLARVDAQQGNCLVGAGSVTSLADLAKLNVLRKSDLSAWQKAQPPFGGMVVSNASHVFQSPGPIYEPGGNSHDWWRFGRFLAACGIGEDDIIQNCFGYHLTPAGTMFENGARAVGATVLPAGTKITKAAVSGGALFPSLRDYYAGRGITCLQCYGTADLGNIAYETMPGEGMIVDEGVIVEIVTPGTGEPVPEGEVGEVVVTSLNPDYPLIRFATGDLSAVMPGLSPCGRTNMRIKGWMGRADQTTKIKGMFVRPEQVAALVAKHPGMTRARVIADRDGEADVMAVQCEGAELDAQQIADSLPDILKLKGKVDVVNEGTIARDGIVIEDRRTYDT